MRRHASGGVTLIEMLLFVVLIGGIAGALVTIFGRIAQGNRQALLRRQASRLVQNRLQALRDVPYPWLYPTPGLSESGCDGAPHDDPIHYPPEQITLANAQFTLHTCIAMVEPEGTNATLRHTAQDISTGLKEVTVTAQWMNGRTRLSHTLKGLFQESKIQATPPAQPVNITGEIDCQSASGSQVHCPDVPLYLFNGEAQLTDTTYSDSTGKFIFAHAPAGAFVVQPQLRSQMVATPASIAGQVSMKNPQALELSEKFVLTQLPVRLSFTSNQPDVLVTVSAELPPTELPDLDFAQGSVPHFWSVTLPDAEPWLEIPEGTYSVRCWRPGRGTKAQSVDPAGGLNRQFFVPDTYHLECKF